MHQQLDLQLQIMDTYTIISGTNRNDSFTIKVAQHYKRELQRNQQNVNLLSLVDLPNDFINSDLYGKRSEAFEQIIEKYFLNVNKYIFVVPEYNGSYPGILKLMLEAMPTRIFTDKKSGIVGVSSGHAGNLRGQDHLTSVLHYLKMNVHYNKPKLSAVDKLFENGELTNPLAISKLNEHVQQIMSF